MRVNGRRTAEGDTCKQQQDKTRQRGWDPRKLLRQILCRCRDGCFLQCTLLLLPLSPRRGLFGNCGLLETLDVSMSSPEAEDGCGEYNKLWVDQGDDYYFAMHLKRTQLTISAAGMIRNCLNAFQRGSSDGNMNNMNGRRNTRVNTLSESLRWKMIVKIARRRFHRALTCTLWNNATPDTKIGTNTRAWVTIGPRTGSLHLAVCFPT